MKRNIALLLALVLLLSGCQAEPTVQTKPPAEETTTEIPAEISEQTEEPDVSEEVSQESVSAVSQPSEAVSETVIVLDDANSTVNGEPISNDPTQAVYAAQDIVYYPTGQDFTFGEGTEGDAHAPEQAAAHTVVHITQPGTYSLSGQLTSGQIAVDLGEDAEEDPDAVVTLILNGVDISCYVAPAVIFYNVYECGNKDTPTETVDTTAAGANILLADGSVNNITGAYVARIYKPDTVELSEDGTEVVNAKKLHKYDAAFYSKMSMNVNGNDGILNIYATNEGLDSELHLTINGGDIRITAGNDGINTNEDGVSVTTINGGKVSILVNGATGEGDGIDSNGWLVINGGTVTAAACGFSGDAGIDSDMGIYLNGGTVIASGHMLDRIAGGNQTYAVFTFAGKQSGGSQYTLKDSSGTVVMEAAPANDFSVLILSGDALLPGDYTFWRGTTQLVSVAMGESVGLIGGGGGLQPPDAELPVEPKPPVVTYGTEVPAQPDGTVSPEWGAKQEWPEAPEAPEMPEPPEFEQELQPPQGGFGRVPAGSGSTSATFTIVQGGNYFNYITEI